MVRMHELCCACVLTYCVTHRLDGKHTVFGEVVSGYDIVKKVEALGSASGKPKAKITIAKSGTV